MMDVELGLLDAAVKGAPYTYYHLLSGQDLPIKSQDFIHAYFNRYPGKDYVRFQEPTFHFDYRIRHFIFFRKSWVATGVKTVGTGVF